MKRLSVLAVCCLVLLAGCNAPLLGRDGGVQTGAPANVDTRTPVSGPSATAQSSDPSTRVAARSSPWGDDPVVVGIDAPDGREYAPLLRKATAYWEANARRYAGYDIDYEVRPNADSPDVAVRFVDDVPTCGHTRDAVGCAPLITDRRQRSATEEVYVETGLSDDSTVLVLEHELGHTLGLKHSDAPQHVMEAKSILYTQPQPNATERAFPWKDTDFTVYVDAANASDPDVARDQVGHALDYYEGGADGTVPSNLTFRYVDSPENADIVVSFDDSSTCSDTAGSCFRTVGPDPDGDDAIEWYSQLRIVLVGLDSDAVGWHVGNWLAYGFGMEDADEVPPPFRNASYRDRRSEWWQ